MSVELSVTLPNNPATGLLQYVPLGGDGYTDPFAMYVLRNFLLTGDASGGFSEIEVVMDDRFCSMVQFASVIFNDTSADPLPVRWVLGSSLLGTTPNMFRVRDIPALAAATGEPQSTDMWLPPAFLLPGADFSALSVKILNGNTDTMQLFTSIFLFNVNARQKVPYSRLVQARGGIGNGN